MAHDVFVSHSAKDRSVAETIVASLEAESLRCWVAPRDIVPGADWGESIIDAIAASRVMVLVFSANANASSQIKREIERAVDKGIYTIPFRVDDTEPTKSLEYFISASHWIDAFPPPLEKHLERLSHAVKAILAKTVSTPVEAVMFSKQASLAPNDAASHRRTAALVWSKPIVAFVGLLILGALVLSLKNRNRATSATALPSPSPLLAQQADRPAITAQLPKAQTSAKPVNAPDQGAGNEPPPRSSVSQQQVNAVPAEAAGAESPEDLVRRFYSLINRGEYRRAYDCLHSTEQYGRKWDVFKKDFAEIRSIEVREINEKSREPAYMSVMVFYVATTTDGRTHEAYFELKLAREQKADRPWRIYSHYLRH